MKVRMTLNARDANTVRVSEDYFEVRVDVSISPALEVTGKISERLGHTG